MYLLSFMDRGNIGNAKLDGLMTQLNLTGDRYNIALAMYFVSYCFFEAPSNLIIQVIPPSRWLPGIMVIWGLAMMLMGFVTTYPQLVAVRFCLGVAEAGLYPGVTYYYTFWYPRYKYQFHLALFSGASAAAGAFSGLLAFAIDFMNGDGGLEGWSWIFILEGIATVVIGGIAFLVMVDYPSTAKFLSPEERAYVIQKQRCDAAVNQEDHMAQQVWAAFTDWQVWSVALLQLTISGPSYGITYFLPTIINNFGYSTSITQLLTIPPYVLATIVLLVFAHYSDKCGMRSPFIFASQFIALAGYAINISNASSGVKYFGIYLCVIGSYAASPGCVSWMANNLGGKYKRAIGVALEVTMGNVGGAIACNIFRTQDEPRYIPGFGVEMALLCLGLVINPIIALTYKRINARRDAAARDAGVREKEGDRTGLPDKGVEVGEFLGDRAPTFRYTH
ncbi:MFS general substrate transporter [Phlebopus sp. FC_14]|nr:MFS general substrate transporter [Phlebopus sp. FC_14]